MAPALFVAISYCMLFLAHSEWYVLPTAPPTTRDFYLRLYGSSSSHANITIHHISNRVEYAQLATAAAVAQEGLRERWIRIHRVLPRRRLYLFPCSPDPLRSRAPGPSRAQTEQLAHKRFGNGVKCRLFFAMGRHGLAFELELCPLYVHYVSTLSTAPVLVRFPRIQRWVRSGSVRPLIDGTFMTLVGIVMHGFCCFRAGTSCIMPTFPAHPASGA